jgi:transcriptional regulator with XRE-family HTH domain
MPIYWNVKERAATKGWSNAHQLAKAVGLSYPVAWRILQDEPVGRVDAETLEALARAFDLKTPWPLLDYRPGKRP